MNALGYTFDITYSAEDDGWVVTFPALLGCSAHGESYTDAIDEAKTAMTLWLATAADMGRELPEPEWLSD